MVYATLSLDAQHQIEKLLERYNTLLDGKWNQMISEVPPGYTALYQQMPELKDTPMPDYRLPDNQRHPSFSNKIDLSALEVHAPFRLLTGIGTDWQSLQMGEPLDFETQGSIDIPLKDLNPQSSDIQLCISVVPMWPVAYDRSNKIAVSVDNGEPQILENRFKEWGREWKIQVLENSKEFVLTLPLDKSRQNHTVTLSIIDPGQIIQKITYE